MYCCSLSPAVARVLCIVFAAVHASVYKQPWPFRLYLPYEVVRIVVITHGGPVRGTIRSTDDEIYRASIESPRILAVSYKDYSYASGATSATSATSALLILIPTPLFVARTRPVLPVLAPCRQ